MSATPLVACADDYLFRRGEFGLASIEPGALFFAPGFLRRGTSDLAPRVPSGDVRIKLIDRFLVFGLWAACRYGFPKRKQSNREKDENR